MGSVRIKHPLLTVDTIIFCENDSVVLIRRKNPPYKNSWALPGGFVEYGETVESAAKREAEEETGLKVVLEGIVGVYSDPKRDPRGHVISICFKAHKKGGNLKANTDAAEVACFLIPEILKFNLAFDHKKILTDYWNEKSS